MIGIFIDGIVITLLIVTISYCWRLNNKIMELKNSKQDLLGLVKTFDVAIAKTHKNIAELKNMSASSTAELQSYLQKANELVGDLSFMTETASKLADRLERGILDSRTTNDYNVNKFRNEHLEKMIAAIGNSNEEYIQEPQMQQQQNSNGFTRTRSDLISAIQAVKNRG